MNTRRLEEGSRLFGSIRWGAIVTGVFVALALQTLLLLLGIAFGLSVGDESLGGGYAVWAVIVQLFCLFVGAALAAALSRSHSRMGGIAAGVMTWAVALVIGGALGGLSLTQRLDGTAAWSAFVGALLGLLASILGGAFGATLGGRRSEIAEPMAPATPIGTV